MCACPGSRTQSMSFLRHWGCVVVVVVVVVVVAVLAVVVFPHCAAGIALNCFELYTILNIGQHWAKLAVMTSVDLLNLIAGPLARCGLDLEVRLCPGRRKKAGEFSRRKARTGGDNVRGA